MMTELWVGGLCFLVGGGLAWVLCRLKVQGDAERRIHEEALKASGAMSQAEAANKERESATREVQTLREELRRAQAAQVAAETTAKEVEKRLQEERVLLGQAREKLSDAFKTLAAEALDASSKRFLTLAEERLKAVKDEAAVDLEARRTAIETLVKPLGEALTKYQSEAVALEGKRQGELGALGKQLETLATTQNTLQAETGRLVNALQSNTVRGRWGEVALRRIAELAGMTPHCDFEEQQVGESEDGSRGRPDMVIKLPAGRQVALDAKVPLAGYLEGLKAETDKARRECLGRFAVAVKGHVDALSNRQYVEQFEVKPEFVVLFLPNDSFLAAAAEHEPALIDYAMERKVVIATPATLIALLRAVAYGWRQEQVAEQSQRIWDLGVDLSDKVATLSEYVGKVGLGLKNAVVAYNLAVGSIESRLLASARKFKGLGVSGRKEIEELPMIEAIPRTFANSGKGTEALPTGNGRGAEAS